MLVLPGAVYKHYKGGLYNVIGTKKLSDYKEEHVLYNSISQPRRAWLRPKSMFLGLVDSDEYRFEGVSNIPEWIKERISMTPDEFNIIQIPCRMYREYLEYRISMWNKKFIDCRGSATHTESEDTYLIFDDIAINCGQLKK